MTGDEWDAIADDEDEWAPVEIQGIFFPGGKPLPLRVTRAESASSNSLNLIEEH